MAETKNPMTDYERGRQQMRELGLCGKHPKGVLGRL